MPPSCSTLEASFRLLLPTHVCGRNESDVNSKYIILQNTARPPLVFDRTSQAGETHKYMDQCCTL